MNIRTVTILRPFPANLMRGGDIYPLRIVIVPDSKCVLERFNENKGAKAAESLRAYYCHARHLKGARSNKVEGEICFSAFAFDHGVIAHESYHAVCDARRVNRLHREVGGWEETIAHSLEYLSGVIWRRANLVAWKVRHRARLDLRR